MLYTPTHLAVTTTLQQHSVQKAGVITESVFNFSVSLYQMYQFHQMTSRGNPKVVPTEAEGMERMPQTMRINKE